MKYASWDIPPVGEPVEELPELLGRVLAARGIASPQEAREFLRSDEGLLHDPFLMKDMDKAARRLRDAVRDKERVAVYGDYDVDGMSAACLLYEYITRNGGRAVRYIPRRLTEGYGLNKGALQGLKAQGCTLVVTVDCGITAVEEAEYARELGLELIITDHHTCKGTLPRALAVVDPQRPDCPYPFKGLAGVGVALKLVLAMGGMLDEYVDLAALGTVADVMPLVDENRAIVRKGLALLPFRPGIACLLAAAGMEEDYVSATTLSFTICPRLNAAGRLGVTEVAEELLLVRDRNEKGPRLAEELCRLNRERQTLEGDIFRDCLELLERQPQEGAALVLAGEGWHQGVVGIVASRLAEKYDKPAFIISLENGMGKGSCRSAGGVSLFRALEGCAAALEGFGGHDMAAGFTVREENIPRLKELLDEWVAAHRAPDAKRTLQTDCVIDDPGLLSLWEVENLSRLEPFGAGNPKPVLVLAGCELRGLSRVGDQGRHLKFSLRKKGRSLPGIFFSFPQEGFDLREGDRIDAAFTPQVSRFRGRESVQLQAVDLRRAENAEESLYWKYSRGDSLTPQEARALIPSRAEFEGVWRYLRARAPLVLDLPGEAGWARRVVSLEVFEERGLIRLERGGRNLSVSLRAVTGKVDLEESPILRGLRGAAQG